VGGLVVRCREMASSGRGGLPEEERWSGGSWMRRWWAVGSGEREEEDDTQSRVLA
jgi:hypothetical protein